MAPLPSRRAGASPLPSEPVRPSPRDEYQTVGGLVMGRLGLVSETGDAFEGAGRRFEVVDVDVVGAGPGVGQAPGGGASLRFRRPGWFFRFWPPKARQ